MKHSRHSNYQKFSENLKINRNTINLDKMRFDWIKKIIKPKNKIKKVTEIGSNLGYFCIKFNHYFGTRSIGYEYEKITFKKANKLKKKNKDIKYINKELNLKNLGQIKKTDLLIHHNVLHHAGHMYDKKLINSKNDWFKYSVNYMRILSKKSKYLFFQSGNVNYNINYFQNDETFKVLPLILKKAGWRIIKIGNIDLVNKNIIYKTYNLKNILKIPKIKCFRDKKTNKVFYKKKDKIIFKYKTGFLQRPLFWCISKNFK